MSVSSITLDSTYLPTSYLFSFYVLLSCFLFCTHVPLPFRTSTSTAQLCQNKPYSQSGLISHCNFSPKPAIFGGLLAGNPHSSRAVLACRRRPQQHGGQLTLKGATTRSATTATSGSDALWKCWWHMSFRQIKAARSLTTDSRGRGPSASRQVRTQRSAKFFQRLCMLLIPKWSTI